MTNFVITPTRFYYLLDFRFLPFNLYIPFHSELAQAAVPQQVAGQPSSPEVATRSLMYHVRVGFAPFLRHESNIRAGSCLKRT